MITVENLQVHYGDYCALNIDRKIQFNEGDKIGIIGSNGAGKTTFIKACLGLVPFTGSLKSNITPSEMAVHMQSNSYVDTMSTGAVMEALLETNLKTNARLRELIDFFDFKASLKKKYKALSGGQKQRFTVIMVLMQDAPITFFDEVTTGLDFETRQQLMDKLNAWYAGKKATLFLVTHYYEELEKMADKLLILDEGKIVAFGPTQELFGRLCGYSVLVFGETPETEQLAMGCRRLQSQVGTIALACRNAQEELDIVQRLSGAGINYKRSSNDVEMIFLNAIQTAKLRREAQ